MIPHFSPILWVVFPWLMMLVLMIVFTMVGYSMTIEKGYGKLSVKGYKMKW